MLKSIVTGVHNALGRLKASRSPMILASTSSPTDSAETSVTPLQPPTGFGGPSAEVLNDAGATSSRSDGASRIPDYQPAEVGTGSEDGDAGPAPTSLAIGGPTTNSVTGGHRPPADPAQAAAHYLAWVLARGLADRTWTVDEIWCLATEFAVASNAVLPSRNLFLGALKRLPGVQVQYDKRIRVGSATVKTTVYRFGRRDDPGVEQARVAEARPRATAMVGSMAGTRPFRPHFGSFQITLPPS